MKSLSVVNTSTAVIGGVARSIVLGSGRLIRLSRIEDLSRSVLGPSALADGGDAVEAGGAGLAAGEDVGDGSADSGELDCVGAEYSSDSEAELVAVGE